MAFVTLRRAASLDPATTRRRLRRTLADYAVPERFVVVDDLPRTAAGKLDRLALRRAAAHTDTRGAQMALHTPEQLTERLAAMRPNIRSRGAAVEQRTEHAPFSPTLLSLGPLALPGRVRPETASTMVAGPDINGEDCHVFWHMATSVEDLLQNLHAARMLAERSPLSGYASIGRDELQALLIVTQDSTPRRARATTRASSTTRAASSASSS